MIFNKIVFCEAFRIDSEFSTHKLTQIHQSVLIFFGSFFWDFQWLCNLHHSWLFHQVHFIWHWDACTVQCTRCSVFFPLIYKIAIKLSSLISIIIENRWLPLKPSEMYRCRILRLNESIVKMYINNLNSLETCACGNQCL